MSNVKERILGAVTIMSESDAEKVWNLIQATFALSNAEIDIPEEDEQLIFDSYHNGDPEYKAEISQAQLLKELGL